MRSRKSETRGETIRSFILHNIPSYPGEISSRTSKKFDISRQAVNKHIQKLIEEDLVIKEGDRKHTSYRLKILRLDEWTCSLDALGGEQEAWNKRVKPKIGTLPSNVMDIWRHGVTEMINNVIDHSEGTGIFFTLRQDAIATHVHLTDNGVGIFKKIKRELGLLDERHSVLELAKGKLTTDPQNHSGEGIFFSSRMFDEFAILSGEVLFAHKDSDLDDWIMQMDRDAVGTSVFMTLSNDSTRTSEIVFDRFCSEDGDYGFSKTIVPVKLTKYGDDKLVSRSQAKRLLTRVDKFKTVILDFQGVDSIGQAFADEIFRVFVNEKTHVKIVPLNMRKKVEQMVQHVLSNK